jgi:hypothetical protein
VRGDLGCRRLARLTTFGFTIVLSDRNYWSTKKTKMASFNPTQIFKDDVTEEKGENARLSAFVGAIAVGDLVKSTLGPKGMDKILQSA